MTTHLKGLVVTFDTDLRDDDAESIADAIRQLRHVLDVAPLDIGPSDYSNRELVRRELEAKPWAVLKRKVGT